MTTATPAPVADPASTRRGWARVPPPSAARAQYMIVAIFIVAAVIRFGTLAAKSYWLDEGLTLQLLHRSFGQMLHGLHATEPDPPLYFALAWIWAHVFGYGEFALRSLSALAGTLTIPVTYLAARRLIGQRGALATAALLAVNPLLVWYSQEARTYALLVLLAALSLLFFARALERPDGTTLVAWGVTCLLMFATHYFAVFLIASEAGWLLWSARGRVRLGWPVGIASLPLIGVAIAASQAQGGPAARATWGGSTTIPFRVISVPAQFLAGFEARPIQLFVGLSGLLVLVPLFLLLRRASPSQRRGALIAGSVGLMTIALPIAAAVLGHDYLSPRNVIVALPPLWIMLGAGLGALAGATPARLAALGLCSIALTAVVTTAWTPKYHFQDWRNVAAAMGPSARARAIVIVPGSNSAGLAAYLRRGLRPLGPSSALVSEVDLVVSAKHLGQIPDPQVPDPGAAPTLPAAGFRVAKIDRQQPFILVRFVSSRPLRVTAAIARSAAFVGEHAAVLLEPAPN